MLLLIVGVLVFLFLGWLGMLTFGWVLLKLGPLGQIIITVLVIALPALLVEYCG